MAGETGAGALRRTGGIFTKQHRTRHSSGSFPSDAASLPPAHPFCKRKLQPRKNIVPSDKISPKGGGKIVEFILTCHTSGGDSCAWPRGHFCSGRSLPDCPFLDPILLSCAKKSGVEPPRRNCGGLLRCSAAQQKGRGPFEILGGLGLQCSRSRECSRVSEHSRFLF